MSLDHEAVILITVTFNFYFLFFFKENQLWLPIKAQKKYVNSKMFSFCHAWPHILTYFTARVSTSTVINDVSGNRRWI